MDEATAGVEDQLEAAIITGGCAAGSVAACLPAWPAGWLLVGCHVLPRSAAPAAAAALATGGMLSCPAGDVSMLSGLRDKLQSGRQSLGKRMFKRGQGKAAGASPSKDTLKNTVHVSGPGGASVCLDTAGFASPDAADVAFAAANRYSARGKPSGCHQLPLEPCTPSSLDSSPFLPSLPLPVSVIVCVQEMQDALASSEEEKNALKRQLAKLSKKYAQVTQAAAHTAGIVAGAQAMQRAAEGGDPSRPSQPRADANGQACD